MLGQKIIARQKIGRWETDVITLIVKTHLKINFKGNDCDEVLRLEKQTYFNEIIFTQPFV